ncbi:hypothetical protein BJF78_24745 [Pseudonocardia sp. CNS-139]|nr:hypothetical protein BJF78_24745 [Pseudonocardia sp. CNS-139]
MPSGTRTRLAIAATAVILLTACTPISFTSPALTSPGQQAPYDRDEFGDGWSDVDGDCQDTRQEILIRA